MAWSIRGQCNFEPRNAEIVSEKKKAVNDPFLFYKECCYTQLAFTVCVNLSLKRRLALIFIISLESSAILQFLSCSLCKRGL